MTSLLLSATAALAFAAFSASAAGPEKVVTTPSGLQYVDLVEGTGPTPTATSRVSVHYTGKLPDGKVFDSSHGRGQPFSYVVGQTSLIRGWAEGLSTMKEGGKRRLMIPAKLGYGQQGVPGTIPPNSELIFELELLKVEPAQ
jgi:FKBP-type peptidyl-prolyl cis-trans isomerase